MTTARILRSMGKCAFERPPRIYLRPKWATQKLDGFKLGPPKYDFDVHWIQLRTSGFVVTWSRASIRASPIRETLIDLSL